MCAREHPALFGVAVCKLPQVYVAWAMAVDLGVVEPRHPGLGWYDSCVGRYVPQSAAAAAVGG